MAVDPNNYLTAGFLDGSVEPSRRDPLDVIHDRNSNFGPCRDLHYLFTRAVSRHTVSNDYLDPVFWIRLAQNRGKAPLNEGDFIADRDDYGNQRHLVIVLHMYS